MSFSHIVIAVAIFFGGNCSQFALAAESEASDNGEIETVQGITKMLAEATYTADVETILNHTHPKALELLGGRANARKILEPNLKRIMGAGVKLEEFTFPSKPIFVSGKENEFVIVTSKSIASSSDKRMESVDFKIAARAVGDDEWKFVQGSARISENIHQLFPDFPRDFKFPATSRKTLD